MSEADAFEIGEALADEAQAFVVDAAATEAARLEVCPAFELGEGVALHGGADEGKAFQLAQPGEVFEPGVGQLAVVGESQGLQVRETGERGDPIVTGLRGNDVEGFQVGDMP